MPPLPHFSSLTTSLGKSERITRMAERNPEQYGALARILICVRMTSNEQVMSQIVRDIAAAEHLAQRLAFTRDCFLDFMQPAPSVDVQNTPWFSMMTSDMHREISRIDRRSGAVQNELERLSEARQLANRRLAAHQGYLTRIDVAYQRYTAASIAANASTLSGLLQPEVVDRRMMASDPHPEQVPLCRSQPSYVPTYSTAARPGMPSPRPTHNAMPPSPKN